MGDVKRYDLELSDNRCDCGGARSIDETECEHGDYVRHSDHIVYLNEMKLERDAARSELATLREELAAVKKLLSQARSMVNGATDEWHAETQRIIEGERNGH